MVYQDKDILTFLEVFNDQVVLNTVILLKKYYEIYNHHPIAPNFFCEL